MSNEPSTTPLEQAATMMKWLTRVYAALAMLGVLMSVVILVAPHGNPHNDPSGLALLGLIPAAVVTGLAAVLTFTAGRCVRTGARGGLTYGLVVNGLFALLGLFPALLPTAFFHGWSAVLIWKVREGRHVAPPAVPPLAQPQLVSGRTPEPPPPRRSTDPILRIGLPCAVGAMVTSLLGFRLGLNAVVVFPVVLLGFTGLCYYLCKR